MSDALARRVAEALIAREGTAPAWQLHLEAARVGYARVSMLVRADMLNGYGTAHGGMIFALADSAFAYACNSRNIGTVAQQASIVFLSPVRPDETLVAEAREIALAGRSGAYSVEVKGGDGRLVAHFQGLSRVSGNPIINPENENV
jgi:acyl-CoA thioesterase